MGRCRRGLIQGGLAVLLLLTWAPLAEAHSTRSITIEITEVSAGKALVRVRTRSPADHATVTFDAPCVSSGASHGEEGSDAEAGDAQQVECPGTIAGQSLSVAGLTAMAPEAILIVALRDGTQISRVLTLGEPSVRLPPSQSGLGLARSYVRMGVTHIFTGYDHLLFLLSLVLLLKRVRSVLWAETAFTLSHSLSFSATALGLIRVSAPAAEACIALSLILVALDLGRGDVPSVRKGVGLAFVFGLVHGLGFAGGLREVGLPDHQVSIALLGFAAGIEVGQVSFLALVLLGVTLVQKRPAMRWVESGLATMIGGVSCFWLFERLLVCFGPSLPLG